MAKRLIEKSSLILLILGAEITTKKFVVLHHSILSEGINVNGLEAVLFLRSMDYIGISQTIGRVIRLGDATKTFGLVCIPVYSKVGISTARKVEAVVDTVFNKGEPAISIVNNSQMKDQASVGEETPAIKYDRALSLFTESVLKPDHDLRGCAHNQGLL